MKFIDEVTLFATSGHGGAGCVAFRHEKFIEFGGPSGGDGGKGGDVIFEAISGLSTLLELRHRPHQKAENGHNGMGKNRHGAGGKDLLIKVPVGTVVKDAETDEILADLTENGKRVILLKGGRGGQGNARFASATNKAPKFAQPGEEHEERKLRLELKLMADVGLFPELSKGPMRAPDWGIVFSSTWNDPVFCCTWSIFRGCRSATRVLNSNLLIESWLFLAPNWL